MGGPPALWLNEGIRIPNRKETGFYEMIHKASFFEGSFRMI
jgi:hypothetical protein